MSQEPTDSSTTDQPHPLSYYSGSDDSKPLGPQLGLVVDILAIGMGLAFASAFVDACQINLAEAPMNGGGSAYISSAPCNEQWQKAHPEFAAFVMSIPPLGCMSLLMFFPYLLSVGTLPYLPVLWITYRIIAARRSPRRMIVLGFAILPLILVLPWIHDSMAVIAD